VAKRLFDLTVACTALVVLAPVLLVVAFGIRLSSPGPVLYRAERVGLGGRRFTMFKFRSMQHGGAGSPISARGDSRVFPFGAIIRKAKLDELPQLLNVVLGDMSIVGPRPEDPAIVEAHYTPEQRETLDVLPGLASPGSIYNYTHGEKLLAEGEAETAYVERLLPVKLALDLVYVRERSLAYDLSIVWRTAVTIVKILAGVDEFPEPAELHKARSDYAFI